MAFILWCDNLKLYSGPPHNYKNKKTNLGKKDEILIIMNMKNGTLKFKTDKEDKENYYINIPLDKSITPSVILCDQNDLVEIMEWSKFNGFLNSIELVIIYYLENKILLCPFYFIGL